MQTPAQKSQRNTQPTSYLSSFLGVSKLVVLAIVLFLSTVFANFAVADLARPSATARPSAIEKTILFIGDSLTDGYGVKKDEAYPEVVGKILREHSHSVRVLNGSISGSVSTDADRRLKWFLKAKPDVLVLALGGNDALKGTPVKVIKKNLAAVIDLAKENRIAVLLCGIQVFTNFGPEYGRALQGIYRELATEKKVALIPFLLEGVALDKSLNQSDMKHPNAKGHQIIGQNVARELEKLL